MSRIGFSKSLPKKRLLPFTGSLKIIEKHMEYRSFLCSSCSKYGLVEGDFSGYPVLLVSFANASLSKTA